MTDEDDEERDQEHVYKPGVDHEFVLVEILLACILETIGGIIRAVNIIKCNILNAHYQTP